MSSILQDKEFWRMMLIALAIIGGIGSVTYFGFVGPQEDRINKIIADNNAKSKAEHDLILKMDCDGLHNALLHSEFYDSDNQALARNHYIAMCEGVKP